MQSPRFGAPTARAIGHSAACALGTLVGGLGVRDEPGFPKRDMDACALHAERGFRGQVSGA